jgi:hypothetical protein
MPAARAVPRVSVRWVTPDDELDATGWEDLAKKMKLPPGKKDASEAVHRLRVLNSLGSAGWELVGQRQEASSADEVWTFKRRSAR